MASKDKPEKPEKGAKAASEGKTEKAAAKKPAAPKETREKAAAKPAAAAKKKADSEKKAAPAEPKTKKPAAAGKEKVKPTAGVKAVGRYLRTAPRKLRLVADAIRGRSVEEAKSILAFTPKAAAHVLAKVLNSAIANAENNKELDPDTLVVARAFVDQGPSIKRFIPRARGRASTVRKRTSHVTIELKVREEGR